MRSVPLLLFLLVATAVSASGAELGSHELSPGVDARAREGACAVCHNVSETAAVRGWGRQVIQDCSTGWFTQEITKLCWGCHATTGPGHDVTTTAMNVGNHSYVVGGAPPGAKDPMAYDNASVGASKLPYTAGSFMQCTSCHNVHSSRYRPFLMKSSIRSLCDACHPGRNYSTVRGNNTAGFDNVSVHPVDVTLDNSAGGGVPTSIKSVSQIDNALKTPLVDVDNNWVLGGKLTLGATGVVSCETCHAVHGPRAGGAGINDLLSIDNRSGDSGTVNNPLCAGCHFGGQAGGSVGLPGRADHPMDNNAGKPFVPGWASIPSGWTGRLDRGAAQLNSAGRPRCSTCHDAHGGVGGTSLLRSPVPAAAGGKWCWSCHAASPVQAAPPGHHSAQGLDNGPDFVSAVTCEMCHHRGEGGHNGFYASFYQPSGVEVPFTTARGTTVTRDNVLNNSASSLCLFCHRDDNPLAWRNAWGHTDNSAIAAIPRYHGTARGTGSHYLGADTNLFPGVDVKTTPWAADNSATVSRYGPGQAVICESCHSVLFNDGAVHPALYTGIDPAFRGWWTNLLLKPYEDDAPGTAQAGSAVGSELCVGCHGAGSTSHHPLTDNIVSTTGLALITGSGSLADQTNAPIGGGAAPGTLSYPANNKMDCDSCHKPHGADSDSDVPSGTRLGDETVPGRNVNLLLEVDGPSNDWSSTLCLECHSK